MVHSCAWWVASQSKEPWFSPRNTFQRRLETGFLLLSKHTQRKGGKIEKGDGRREKFSDVARNEGHLSGNKDGIAGDRAGLQSWMDPQGGV